MRKLFFSFFLFMSPAFSIPSEDIEQWDRCLKNLIKGIEAPSMNYEDYIDFFQKETEPLLKRYDSSKKDENIKFIHKFFSIKPSFKEFIAEKQDLDFTFRSAIPSSGYSQVYYNWDTLMDKIEKRFSLIFPNYEIISLLKETYILWSYLFFEDLSPSTPLQDD